MDQGGDPPLAAPAVALLATTAAGQPVPVEAFAALFGAALEGAAAESDLVRLALAMARAEGAARLTYALELAAALCARAPLALPSPATRSKP